MTTILLAIIAVMLIFAYLFAIVKQVDVQVIKGGAHQQPVYHVHKRRWEVWWEEWGRPVWWLAVGSVLGWLIRGLG